MGTVVNIQVGARSPLAGIFRALILMAVVFVAGGLTEPIPLAVLAGIAVYVGINILDWSFIQRAHKLSISQMAIMYGVMLLTVFVDLIAAVGLGVFISNIMVIERLSRVQSEQVKAISDSDDDVPMNEKEHSLFEKANGQLLYFYLSGPMIFSVSKAIARQHRDISKYKAMVLDLSDVPMLDVTVSLALENAITDALDAKCKVFIYSPNPETSDQLHRFQINEKLGENAFCNSRSDALERALNIMKPNG